jgi:hypothetical protein
VVDDASDPGMRVSARDPHGSGLDLGGSWPDPRLGLAETQLGSVDPQLVQANMGLWL